MFRLQEELISVEVAKTAKGGVLKRVAEEDEEWQYQDNVLTYNHGSQPQKFEWDGFTLKELKSKVDDSCLIGHWDGGVIRIRKGETLLMQFIYIPGFIFFFFVFFFLSFFFFSFFLFLKIVFSSL